jgi:hypothetical protein
MTSNTLDTPKVSAGFDINAEFRSVMHDLGLSPEDTGGSITFVGEDPIFPTKHRLGACISIPIMAGAAHGGRSASRWPQLRTRWAIGRLPRQFPRVSC